MSRRGGSCHSGAIWKVAASRRRSVVAAVCLALQKEYGLPRHGNPNRPLDDLIFIVLTNRSSPVAAARVYRGLRREFPKWDDLLSAPAARLRELLRPLGLHVIRTRYLRSLLLQLQRDFGRCTLTPIRHWSSTDQAAYLQALSGVSEKVAKCVMMYTLEAKVLPVDTHVHRVARRLGWVNRRRADQCHGELEALVPAVKRYAFHVDCIAHGRAICRSQQPRCLSCVLRRWCDYGQERSQQTSIATRSR